jgi:hypothetical protein
MNKKVRKKFKNCKLKDEISDKSHEDIVGMSDE